MGSRCGLRLFICCLSVFLSFFGVGEKKVTRSILHPSQRFWHSWREARKGGRCDCERGRRILGSPDREPWEWQFEFVPFSKRVPVTDREEHCLKLVTGGEDVSPPRFFLSQWPKESRNPQHVYQETPCRYLHVSHALWPVLCSFIFYCACVGCYMTLSVTDKRTLR